MPTKIQKSAPARKAKTPAATNARRRATAAKLPTGLPAASGFAHNFNNLLTIIAGNLQLIDARVTASNVRKPLHEALIACEIGARMVQNLLTYACQRRLALKPYDVNPLITELLVLVRRIAGDGVTVVFEPGTALPRVRLDKGEFENAIVNLSLNARDSMPSGGTIDIKTAFERSQSRVIVSVTDTGTGMPAHVAARASEPFFSTKASGLGTGLGLATVAGFLEQLGGSLEIVSAAGKGTTVRLAFPGEKRKK